MASFGSHLLAAAVAGTPPGERPLRHVAELPPQAGRPRGWPEWAEPDVVDALPTAASARRGHTRLRPPSWRTPAATW